MSKESTAATVDAHAVVERFADEVAVPGRVTTWLNHWSLLHADWKQLAEMDLIGFDGTLLQVMLARRGHRVGRSSADLVLPHVFAGLPRGTRVALIGANPGVADTVATRLADFDVMPVDGYGGLTALRNDPSALVAFDPRLVVIGLGAGLQERIASTVHRWLPHASVCTAGGWLDQFAKDERYFPEWVHRCRLGWAWRIAHEPRRLIGRYTVEAVDFMAANRRLIDRLEGLGEFTELGLVRG